MQPAGPKSLSNTELSRIIFLTVLLAGASLCSGQEANTFTNPIFNSGADPWMVWGNGEYYYVRSARNGVALQHGKNLDDLKQSQPVTVWSAPEGTMWSREIWAPEMHFIDNKWYVYFAADNGQNRNHRMYVIENSSPDPLAGTWVFRGKVADKSDRWAIDGNVFRFRDKLYMTWSGWEGDVNGQQNLYIAEMSDPCTISSDRVLISTPSFPWETIGDLNNPDDVPHVNVNEGPAALVHGKRLFIIYSASGCWTDSYCLGMLTFKGGNILDASSWKKNPDPVFKGLADAGAYATGHNSFFKSPDGKEDWILYHANPSPGQGCGRFRSPRAQKFRWNRDGSPFFGEPVKTGTPVILPSVR
jgi:GH43 family beta-xylosidase